MALYNFHRVLIAAAIVFDFMFTFWSLRQWRITEGSDSVLLVMAVASSIVTVALVAYLVYFNRNLTLLRHIVSGHCWKCGVDIRSALMAGGDHCPGCGVALAQPAARAS